MLRKAESHCIVAKKSKDLLNEQRHVDKYVDAGAQKSVIEDIQKRYSVQIENARNYKQKEKLYKKMSSEQFNAMVKLDKSNELHPSKHKKQ